MNSSLAFKTASAFGGLLCLALLSGCVTGRRSVALPINSQPQSSTTKGEVSVASVVDKRYFENKPRDPSTPSVDGDVAALSEAERSTMIGRQRNAYGKALGDVALPPGETVPQRARVLIEEAFKRRDYRISSGAATNVVDVVVNEFWGWSTPGAFSIAFEARVACTLTIKGSTGTQTLRVNGAGRNQAQVASDPNWQLAYHRAFEDFIVNLHRELGKVGL
jgi:hypothetical protein